MRPDAFRSRVLSRAARAWTQIASTQSDPDTAGGRGQAPRYRGSAHSSTRAAQDSDPDGSESLAQLNPDESLVNLRCSVIVIRGESVLLVRRLGPDAGRGEDWVLPGGRPRPHEGMLACARREVLEETGVSVTPKRCAFIGEVIGPERGPRTVELIFSALIPPHAADPTLVGEPGTEPAWVGLPQLRELPLRPPIAGYLPGLVQGGSQTAPYLGNLWRGGGATDGSYG